jgi:hypothetical protein
MILVSIMGDLGISRSSSKGSGYWAKSQAIRARYISTLDKVCTRSYIFGWFSR